MAAVVAVLMARAFPLKMLSSSLSCGFTWYNNVQEVRFVLRCWQLAATRQMTTNVKCDINCCTFQYFKTVQ